MKRPDVEAIVRRASEWDRDPTDTRDDVERLAEYIVQVESEKATLAVQFGGAEDGGKAAVGVMIFPVRWLEPTPRTCAVHDVFAPLGFGGVTEDTLPLHLAQHLDRLVPLLRDRVDCGPEVHTELVLSRALEGQQSAADARKRPAQTEEK